MQKRKFSQPSSALKARKERPGWNSGEVWSKSVEQYRRAVLNSMVEQWKCGEVEQCGNSVVDECESGTVWWNNRTVKQCGGTAWNSMEQYGGTVE